MTTTPEREALAATICQWVAELPDRNSPDDWPEAMLVTATELREVVLDALAASPAAGGVQPLTDERIDDCMPLGMHAHSVLCGPDEIRRFARRIEARAAPPAAPAQPPHTEAPAAEEQSFRGAAAQLADDYLRLQGELNSWRTRAFNAEGRERKLRQAAPQAPAAQDERGAFEAFQVARKNRGAKRATMFARLPDGTYADESVQRHWWTWQNALAARAPQAAADGRPSSRAKRAVEHQFKHFHDTLGTPPDRRSDALAALQAAPAPQPEAAEPAPVQPVAYFINDAAAGDPPHYAQIAAEFANTPGAFPLYATLPVESVERDAARFAWLVENVVTGSIGFGDWWIDAQECKDSLRAAIDAALAGHKEQQP